MTNQEAYEAIRGYFTQPGAELARLTEANGDFICQYRTPDGRKCALGCLIPDELYVPGIENLAAYALLEGHAVGGFAVSETAAKLQENAEAVEKIREHFNGVSTNFLSRAQSLHDSGDSASVEEFVKGLDELAAEYGLTVAA